MRLNDSQKSLYDRVNQQDQKVDAVRRDYDARAAAQDRRAESRAAALERMIENYGVSNRHELMNFQRELGRYEESLQRLQPCGLWGGGARQFVVCVWLCARPSPF